MGRMNLDGRGSSVVLSPRQEAKLRPKSAGQPLTSTGIGPNHDAFSYDSDEEEHRSPKSRHTTKMSWAEEAHEMKDTSTQTVVHSGNPLHFSHVRIKDNGHVLYVSNYW